LVASLLAGGFRDPVDGCWPAELDASAGGGAALPEVRS
jgi:hypothetical protein